jgi:hypothetical protein
MAPAPFALALFMLRVQSRFALDAPILSSPGLECPSSSSLFIQLFLAFRGCCGQVINGQNRFRGKGRQEK